MMIGLNLYKVYRQRGEYVAGLWTDRDTPEVFEVLGSLQPMDAKLAVLLEASARSSQRWSFYADAFQRELKISTPESTDGRGHPGDVLHSGDRRFVVVGVTTQEASGAFHASRAYALSELGVDTLASEVVE